MTKVSIKRSSKYKKQENERSRLLYLHYNSKYISRSQWLPKRQLAYCNKMYCDLLSRNRQINNFHNSRTGHLMICAPTTRTVIQFENNIQPKELDFYQDQTAMQMRLNNLIKTCNLRHAFIITVTNQYSLLSEMCNQLKLMVQYCENVTVVLHGHGVQCQQTQNGMFQLHNGEISLNSILQELTIFCLTSNINTKRLTIVFGNCFGHLFDQRYRHIFNIKSFTNDTTTATQGSYRFDINNGSITDSVHIQLQEFYKGTYGLSTRHFRKEFRQALEGHATACTTIPQYHK